VKPRSWFTDGLQEVRRALRAGEAGIAVELAGLVARETGQSRDEVVVRAWGLVVGRPPLRRAA
jgi:hypothetical protein